MTPLLKQTPSQRYNRGSSPISTTGVDYLTKALKKQLSYIDEQSQRPFQKTLADSVKSKSYTSLVYPDGKSMRSGRLSKLEDYANGELFLDGAYYRGRVPFTQDDNKTPDMQQVEKLLVTDDIISWALDKYVDGVLGKDFRFEIRRKGFDVSSSELDIDQDGEESLEVENQPSNTEDGELNTNTVDLARELNGYEESLELWIKEAGFRDTARQGMRVQQWAGNSIFRVYIPDEYSFDADIVNQDNNPDGRLVESSIESLDRALELIECHVLTPLHAGTIKDAHKRDVAYFYAYEEEDLSEASAKAKQFIEVHLQKEILLFSNDDGLKQLTYGELYQDMSREDAKEFVSTPSPLYDENRKRRPYYMMGCMTRSKGTVLTKSIMDLQDRIVVDETNKSTNTQFAGFPAWTSTNMDDQAEIIDSDGNVKQDNLGRPLTEKVDIDISIDGITNAIGIPLLDANNDIKGYSGVDLKRIEPVDPSYIIKTLDDTRETLLRKLDLLHTRQVAAVQSGEARDQLRQPFEKRIIGEAPAIAKGIQWALETVLTMGFYLTQGLNIEEARAFEIVPILELDVTSKSLEIFKALLEAYKLGAISIKTLLKAVPVEGLKPDIELKLIEAAKAKNDEAALQARRQDLLTLGLAGAVNDTTT